MESVPLHYIYQGQIHCESCGDAICQALEEDGLAPPDGTPDDECTEDTYPKGPYRDMDGGLLVCVTCGAIVR